MDKKEFLARLREYLDGEVPSYEIEKNIRYYDGYIKEHGTSREDELRCVQEIGDPRLVATTIITSFSMSGQAEERKEEYYEEEEQQSEQKDNLHAIPLKYKVIGILSTAVLLFILFWILKVFFFVAIRILFPVTVIAIIMILINKLFNR